MCGRYTLRTPAAQWATLFDLSDLPDLAPRYNVAPTQSMPIVRQVLGLGRQMALARWGLIPSWADDPAIGNRMINARSDTAAEKPSFRSAMRERRCLIPADGFYEWPTIEGRKQPCYIHRRDGQPFAFGGLWERWTRGAEPIESFTILTTDANQMLQSLHDRMPVVVQPEDFTRWLDPTIREAAKVADLLRPAPNADWEITQVGTLVNSARHDVPECLAPLRQNDTLFDV